MKLDSIRVLVEGEPGPPRTFDDDEIRIGSSHACELVIDDPSVEAVHALISSRHGYIEIADNGTEVGTFYNNLRLRPRRPGGLSPGTVIRLGSRHLRLCPEVNAHGPWALPRSLGEVEPEGARLPLAQLEAWLRLVADPAHPTTLTRADLITRFVTENYDPVRELGAVLGRCPSVVRFLGIEKVKKGAEVIFEEPVSVDAVWLTALLRQGDATLPEEVAAEIGRQLQGAFAELEAEGLGDSDDFPVRPLGVLLCADGRVRIFPAQLVTWQDGPRRDARRREADWRAVMGFLHPAPEQLPALPPAPELLAQFLEAVAGVAFDRQRALVDELGAM